MRKLSLMISPTDRCNINCEYCYNLPRRIKNGNKVIDLKLVERTLKLVSEYVETPEVQLVWHGGEPTTLGIEWFENIQPLIFKYSNKVIWNQGIQSNLTLIDDEWVKFLKKYNISVSGSYDVFDQNIRGGEDKVWNNIVLLLENKIKLGLLTTLNSISITKMVDIYEFYKSKGIGGFCFNPAYILEDAPESAKRLAIDPYIYLKEWGKYFKHWLEDYSDNLICERSVNDAIASIFSSLDMSCSCRDCQNEYLTVNCNGEMTSCNRYCPDEFIYGNIMDINSIKEIYTSRGYCNYMGAIIKRREGKCADCSYLNICKGGCNLDHTLKKSGFDEHQCITLKGTFDIAYNEFREISLDKPVLNNFIFSLIMTNEFFTLKEIREFLVSMGYKGEIKYDLNDIPSCQEYNIFKLFNGSLSSKIIQRTPMKKYNPQILNDRGFRETRQRLLMGAYQKNAQQIHNILFKER